MSVRHHYAYRLQSPGVETAAHKYRDKSRLISTRCQILCESGTCTRLTIVNSFAHFRPVADACPSYSDKGNKFILFSNLGLRKNVTYLVLEHTFSDAHTASEQYHLPGACVSAIPMVSNASVCRPKHFFSSYKHTNTMCCRIAVESHSECATPSLNSHSRSKRQNNP